MRIHIILASILACFFALTSTTATAEIRGMKNCKAASRYLTYLAAGGASEDFMKNRFDTYYAKHALNPSRVFPFVLEGAYMGIGQYKNQPNAIMVMVIAAQNYSCKEKWIRKDWK